MLYVDPSALAKRYVYADGASIVFDAMAADVEWATSRLTRIETRRAIALHAAAPEVRLARQRFDADWSLFHEIQLDEDVAEEASRIAVDAGLRTLDAIHLASAIRAGGPELTLLTFDQHLGEAARSIGITTLP